MKTLHEPFQWWLPLAVTWLVMTVGGLQPCIKRMTLARAEQTDRNGLRCWDKVKVSSCGGKCDSREISDWEFPFKKSHHPVCVYGIRRAVQVNLRNCDPGVEPGTEKFYFIAAEDCRCQVCSSKHTSCEWLPPNSTLLDGINNDLLEDDDLD